MHVVSFCNSLWFYLKWKLCSLVTGCSDSPMWAVHGRTLAAVMLMNDIWLLHLLGASVIFRHVCKIAQMTIGFIVSVHPSIHQSVWNNSAPTGWIFIKFYIWGFFKNLSRTLKFEYVTRIMGTLHVDLPIFMIISCWIILRMRMI